MSAILLIIILAILVLSHEFGHFIFAKLFGMKVEEFGIGLPPRITGFKRGETLYSVNWIPFGGFVRILGEDSTNEKAQSDGAFSTKSRKAQAIVVVAGILFNIIFAFLLMWFGFFAIGLPVSTADYSSYGSSLTDRHTVITYVKPGSAGEKAGITGGSTIDEIGAVTLTIVTPSPDDVSRLVREYAGTPISLHFSEGEEILVVPDPLIGIEMDEVGTLTLGPIDSLVVGTKATFYLTYRTPLGIALFLKDTFTGNGSLSAVVGPVGIASLVGEASKQGFASLLLLTVILSITLAVVNCIPFPALDGGRLLFIIIETIKGRPIKEKIVGVTNAVGFALLLLLMVVVTIHDVSKFF